MKGITNLTPEQEAFRLKRLREAMKAPRPARWLENQRAGMRRAADQGKYKGNKENFKVRGPQNTPGVSKTHLGLAKGEQNRLAVSFCLKSPDGVIYSSLNITHFVRTHPELFDPADVVWAVCASALSKKYHPSPSCRASRGLLGLRQQALSWKGWTLIHDSAP